MSYREPAAWETSGSAPTPFLVLEGEHGGVEVWGRGADPFTVRARDRERFVEGFTAAREVAHALATELEQAAQRAR